MAVGEPKQGQADAALAKIFEKVTSSTVHKRRCATPNHVIAHVKAMCDTYGKIHLLDLVDHGSAGTQRWRGEVLLTAPDDRCGKLTGADFARKLIPYLAPMAHVRLLGCNVASAPEPGDRASGRHLLWHLANVVNEDGGRRVCFASISKLIHDDYDEHGFKRDHELSFLFSSLSALDAVPPDVGGRSSHLDPLLRDATCGDAQERATQRTPMPNSTV